MMRALRGETITAVDICCRVAWRAMRRWHSQPKLG